MEIPKKFLVLVLATQLLCGYTDRYEMVNGQLVQVRDFSLWDVIGGLVLLWIVLSVLGGAFGLVVGIFRGAWLFLELSDDSSPPVSKPGPPAIDPKDDPDYWKRFI